MEQNADKYNIKFIDLGLSDGTFWPLVISNSPLISNAILSPFIYESEKDLTLAADIPFIDNANPDADSITSGYNEETHLLDPEHDFWSNLLPLDKTSDLVINTPTVELVITLFSETNCEIVNSSFTIRITFKSKINPENSIQFIFTCSGANSDGVDYVERTNHKINFWTSSVNTQGKPLYFYFEPGSGEQKLIHDIGIANANCRFVTIGVVKMLNNKLLENTSETETKVEPDSTKKELYDSKTSYTNYKDTFKLYLASELHEYAESATNKNLNNEDLKIDEIYYNTSAEQLKIEKEAWKMNALDFYEKGFILDLKGFRFNKILGTSISQTNKTRFMPLILDKDDLNYYGFLLHKDPDRLGGAYLNEESKSDYSTNKTYYNNPDPSRHIPYYNGDYLKNPITHDYATNNIKTNNDYVLKDIPGFHWESEVNSRYNCRYGHQNEYQNWGLISYLEIPYFGIDSFSVKLAKDEGFKELSTSSKGVYYGHTLELGKLVYTVDNDKISIPEYETITTKDYNIVYYSNSSARETNFNDLPNKTQLELLFSKNPIRQIVLGRASYDTATTNMATDWAGSKFSHYWSRHAFQGICTNDLEASKLVRLMSTYNSYQSLDGWNPEKLTYKVRTTPAYEKNTMKGLPYAEKEDNEINWKEPLLVSDLEPIGLMREGEFTYSENVANSLDCNSNQNNGFTTKDPISTDENKILIKSPIYVYAGATSKSSRYGESAWDPSLDRTTAISLFSCLSCPTEINNEFGILGTSDAQMFNIFQNGDSGMRLENGEWKFYPDNLRLLYQNFDWAPGYNAKSLNSTWNAKISELEAIDKYRPIYSYAQMVASLYIQLYKKELDPVTINMIKSYACLDNASEYWKTDLVLKLHIDPNKLNTDYLEDYDGKVSSSKYLKILTNISHESGGTIGYGYLLNDFVSTIIENAKVKDYIGKVSLKNINPVFSDSVKCIEFSYEVPYDVDSIKQYMDPDTNTLYLLYNNITTTENISTGYMNVILDSESGDEFSLYTHNNGVVRKFSCNDPLYYIEDFRTNGNKIVAWTSKEIPLGLNSGSKIDEHLQISGGRITTKDGEVIKNSSNSENKITIFGLTHGTEPVHCKPFTKNHIFTQFVLGEK